MIQQENSLCYFNEDLIIKVSFHDMSALMEIYNKTNKIIYGYALSLTKNKDDAEDILHDTFIKISEYSGRYKPMGKPLAWMFTITKNLCLNKIKEKYKIMHSIEDYNNSIDFSYVHNTDDKIVIESAFTILTDEERNIIILHAITGFKHKEISLLLDIPLSTVLSKYNRSLKKLKNYLEKGDERFGNNQ